MMAEHSPHTKVGRLCGSCFQSSRLQDGTMAGQQKETAEGEGNHAMEKGPVFRGSGPLG